MGTLTRLIVTLSIVMFSNVAFAEPELPSGWSLPILTDYAKYERKFIKGKIPNKVHADFNGDDIKDSAWILINSSRTEWALFVSVSIPSGSYKIIQLDKGSFKSDVISMGIGKAELDKYDTACGKGYWECGEGESPELKLTLPGIDYYRFESASSTFYWSKEINSFKRMWMSD